MVYQGPIPCQFSTIDPGTCGAMGFCFWVKRLSNNWALGSVQHYLGFRKNGPSEQWPFPVCRGIRSEKSYKQCILTFNLGQLLFLTAVETYQHGNSLLCCHNTCPVLFQQLLLFQPWFVSPNCEILSGASLAWWMLDSPHQSVLYFRFPFSISEQEGNNND